MAEVVVASVASKVNVAVWSVVVVSGPEVMVTVGGVVSTVQVRVAGVLVLPAGSVAVTVKVCAPSASPGVVDR